MVGQFAVSPRVFIEVGIEKIDRDIVPRQAADQVAPRADSNRTAFQPDVDETRHRLERLFGFPQRWFFDLVAALVETLMKVTFAMQQRDADHRKSQVSGSAKGVARKNAQAP